MMSVQPFFDLVLEHGDIALLVLFFSWPLLVRLFDLLSGQPRRQAEKRALEQQRALLNAQKEHLDKTLRLQTANEEELRRRQEELLLTESEIEYQRKHLNQEVRFKTLELAKNVASRSYLRDAPAYRALHTGNDRDEARMLSALTSSMRLSSPFNIVTTIRSNSGETYTTTLFDCSCPDYAFRKEPCKHMLRLALEVGLLLSVDTVPLEKKLEKLLADQRAVQKELNALRDEKDVLDKLLAEKQQKFPWLAKLYADYLMTSTDRDIQYLRDKPHPATATADRIERDVRKELLNWRLLAKQEEYQLHFYESLFPWLTEFKEDPPAEAAAYTASAAENGTEYDQVKSWLSPEEYSRLSSSDRNQLLLDRYLARKKSSWDIGIEYERYIGYLCEGRGFSVQYFGATKHLNDMGRDLILEKGTQTILIQCKRWAAEKRIHENHVFQLAGSVFEYQRCHPEKTVIGVFVTTTGFSPAAQFSAERIGIRLYSNVPFQDYPRIKCNISKSGQKIYHLPFDQQYDHVKLTRPGECYAHSVAEAEKNGFRRALRWPSS